MDDEGYRGELRITVGDDVRTAAAALAAGFDPLAGHVTWRGRVAAVLPLRATVLLTTPHGSAEARTTERDVWGNTRLAGLGRPPFPVELLDG